MKILRSIAAAPLFGSLLLSLSPVLAHAAENVDEFRFRVLLDDKEVGHHHFTVINHGEQQTIEIEAKFDVRVLFVPVYRYRHRNKEMWRNGCLTQIDSRTDDNGDEFEVSGMLRGPVFELTTQDGSRVVQDDCLMTFAYWRRDFLEQPRLLNAQNGKVLAVDVERLPEQGKGAAESDGYRIRSRDEELDIRVWYERDSGRWLGLESTVEGGRTLTYLPQSGPPTAAWAQREGG